jgi:hypothetical protein
MDDVLGPRQQRQVGLMTGVRDYSTGELKHDVVALARVAKALKLPRLS